jgi:hypothetical protein
MKRSLILLLIKYYWGDQIEKMKWAGHVTRMERRCAYRVLLGKPEGNRPLEIPRRRWKDNIKMDILETV